MKAEIEEMRDSVNSFDYNMVMHEEEITAAEKERAELERSNKEVNTRVMKYATQKALMKDQERQLDERRNYLMRQLKGLQDQIESLPRKQKNKILKK